MCKKYISVFEESERVNEETIQILNFWNHDNNRPEINVDPWDNFEIHMTQKCRAGGRVCSICDNFKQERIELPYCDNDCECKQPSHFLHLMYNPEEIPEWYTNRDYLKRINRYLDLQREHACVKIINAIREKYPDRHVVIFDARIVVGNDLCHLDHLNIKIWVFKKPSLLKEIEGDHSCKCWDDTQFLDVYKKLENILESFGPTDYSLLYTEVENYQNIVAAENENEDMEYEDNDPVNEANLNISISSMMPIRSDPFGHHKLYSELQLEQRVLEERLRQWRLEREID